MILHGWWAGFYVGALVGAALAAILYTWSSARAARRARELDRRSLRRIEEWMESE